MLCKKDIKVQLISQACYKLLITDLVYLQRISTQIPASFASLAVNATWNVMAKTLPSNKYKSIDGFRGGAEGAAAPLFSTTSTTILLWKSFYRFNSIFREVNITLLCITNTPTICMLHVLKSKIFIRGEWGGGRTWPPLSEFSGSAPVSLFIYTPKPTAL